MANEDLLRFLNDRIGKDTNLIKVPEEFAEKELYILFRSKQIDKLPFTVKVKGYSFDEVDILFSVVSWERNVLKIVYSVNASISNIYKIPIGLIGSENIAYFSPLIAPSEATSKRTTLEKWVDFRFSSKNFDRLSNFLNKELDPTKIMKTLSCRFQYQKGRDIFIFSNPATVSMAHNINKPGHLNLILMEFYKFNIKKDNFFPKFSLSKPLDALQIIYEKYCQFPITDTFDCYPQNPFLSGPEAFQCNECLSIMFPSNIYQVQMPSYIGKLPGHVIAFKSHCPNCGAEREVWSMKDDILTISAGNELFWSCPTHLKLLSIGKESDKKGKKIYELSCPDGCKKIVKDVENQYIEIIKQLESVNEHKYTKNPHSDYVNIDYMR